MDCEYKTNGFCSIATRLSGRDAACSESACKACQSDEFPKQENRVTAGLAVLAWKDDKAKQVELSKQLSHYTHRDKQAVLNGHGPGTALHAILSVAFDPDASCKCWARAKQMNDWGYDGCWDNISTIVDWLVEEAERRNLVEQIFGVAFRGVKANVPVRFACRVVAAMAINVSMVGIL